MEGATEILQSKHLLRTELVVREEQLRSAAPPGCQIQQNCRGLWENGAEATNLKEVLKPAPGALGAEKEKSAAFGFQAAGDPSKEEIT